MATVVCSLRWRGACVRPVRPVRQEGCARLRPDGLRRGKPRYTPWVCLPQCGMTRAIDVPEGGTGFFNGNGGVQSAAAWRLRMDQMDQMDQMDNVGAPRYTPWVCMPQSGLARVKIYR